LPEYCRYQDDGCEFADACLNCPFPDCIYAQPGGGQQLYDVVDISDSRAGLAATKRRVNGLTLVYSPRRGQYRQRLLLGGV